MILLVVSVVLYQIWITAGSGKWKIMFTLYSSHVITIKDSGPNFSYILKCKLCISYIPKNMLIIAFWLTNC